MSDIPKERTEKLFTRVVRSGQKPEEMTSLIATLFQSSSLMQTQARRKQSYRRGSRQAWRRPSRRGLSVLVETFSNLMRRHEFHNFNILIGLQSLMIDHISHCTYFPVKLHN